MSLASGGFNLGAAFGGGGQAYQTAKSTEEMRLISRAQAQAATDQKIDQAIQEQMQRQAMQGVMSDESIPPEARNMIVSKLSGEFANYQLGKEREQKIGFRGDAVEAFKGGDWNLGNANLAGVATGPLTLTDVDGNQVVRNKYRDDGTVAPTNVGLAEAFSKNASGQASLARAGTSNARTNQINDRTDNPQRWLKADAPGKGAGTGTFTPPTEGAIDEYFGNVNQPGISSLGRELSWDKSSLDKRRGFIREFEIWREQNPQYRNGNEALQKFKLRNSTPGAAFAGVPPPSSPAQAANGQVVGGAPYAAPTSAGDGADPMEFATKALQDARRAISEGKISKEEARKRLLKAGLKHSAEAL